MKFNHKKLAKARLAKKLSAYSCARELSKCGMDISHQTILNWEKGIHTPDCHQLAEMAMFFEKELLYFFVKKTHQTRVIKDNIFLSKKHSTLM